jgi:hypothetical protein
MVSVQGLATQHITGLCRHFGPPIPGLFSIIATFTNIARMPLEALKFHVVTLTQGNTVLNSERRGRGNNLRTDSAEGDGVGDTGAR